MAVTVSRKRGLGWLLTVAVDAQGRTVAGGTLGAPLAGRMLVVRFLANGALDSSFSGNGWQVIDFPSSTHEDVQDLAIQRDGRIVIVGAARLNNEGRFAVARLLGNGNLDTSSRNGGGFLEDFNNSTTEYARAVAINSNGSRIAVTGPVQNWGYAVIQ